MKFIKNSIATILALIMIVCAFPTTAYAYSNLPTSEYSLNSICTSEREAAKQLRDALVERKREITIKYRSTVSPDNISLFSKSILDQALSEDLSNSPYSGDALYWSVDTISSKSTTEILDDSYLYTITYTAKMHTTAAQEDELMNKVKFIVESSGLKNKSDFEKVKYIYNYIYNNVNYDYINAAKNNPSSKIHFSAYAALIDKKAVCQGITSLFYIMCKEANVPVRIIAGNNHSWNIVKMPNGKWYNIDVTFEKTANPEKNKYQFFLVGNTDKLFPEHKRISPYNSSDFYASYPMSTTNYVLNGWQTVNGKKYYYKNNEAVKYTQIINGDTYYFNSACVMQTGWINFSGKKKYFASNGKMVKYTQNINGRQYYFNGSGVMQTGLIKFSDAYKFFDNTGAAIKGWKTISGKTYYFGNDYKSVKWRQRINGKLYYFNGASVLQKNGWINGANWFYADKNGVLKTGKVKINSNWYYFDANGALKS